MCSKERSDCARCKRADAAPANAEVEVDAVVVVSGAVAVGGAAADTAAEAADKPLDALETEALEGPTGLDCVVIVDVVDVVDGVDVEAAVGSCICVEGIETDTVGTFRGVIVCAVAAVCVGCVANTGIAGTPTEPPIEADAECETE